MDTNQFTIITPTYNSEKYIKDVLLALTKQTFTNFEVFIVDAGSTDSTKKIIDTFENTLTIKHFNNKIGDSETAKQIGIDNSKSDFIVLLDSDNIIKSDLWLESALNIFNNFPKVASIETPWEINLSDSIFNQYFSLIQIGDPFVKYFSPNYLKPTKIYEDNLCKVILHNQIQPPVTSSGNGVFFRSSHITKKINKNNKFEESNYSSYLISQGFFFANLKAPISTHHYYASNLKNFLKKRRRTAIKFFIRKKNNEKTWVDKIGPMWTFLVTLYSISIIGPITESIYQIIKTKKIAWLIHPLVLFLTTAIYLYYYIKIRILNIQTKRLTEHH